MLYKKETFCRSAIPTGTGAETMNIGKMQATAGSYRSTGGPCPGEFVYSMEFNLSGV